MAKQVRYYRQRDLELREDVGGARWWGIALDETMLTYFEVDPNSTFEMHSHESEQITYVLDGMLIFTTGGQRVRVGRGEAIAIPSMVPHSAHTEDVGAKAVDAWSPVMDKYKDTARLCDPDAGSEQGV